MRPKPPSKTSNEDLFRSRLDAMLDDRHELVRLARLIDWDRFDAAFGGSTSTRPVGRACRHG